MPTRLSRRFEAALLLATRLHATQTRKGGRIPYVSHLLGVASLALEHGADEDVAIGALLHDLNTLASDQGILRGFVSGPSELARAKPDECRR